MLLPPCDRNHVSATLIQKIVTCLSTRFNLTMKEIRPHLRTASLVQYGKLRRLDGDIMNASTMGEFSDDRRDATFIRVSNDLKYNLCHYSIEWPASDSMKCSWIRMPDIQGDLSYSNHVSFLVSCRT
jgi:hypothetical protein